MWITKYRYKVLTYELKKRVREIMAQVSEEMGIKIVNGVVSGDHIHIFVEIPPHVPVSDYVKKAKGRSSRRIQEEYPEIRKRYRGTNFSNAFKQFIKIVPAFRVFETFVIQDKTLNEIFFKGSGRPSSELRSTR